MQSTTEIHALFQLIDDPDQEIFDLISQRIVDYGKPIIPNLEHLWEETTDSHTQERIELLIHRLHFTDLTEEFRQWNVSGLHELSKGAVMISRFLFPDMNETSVYQEIEKIRRNIWLELNNYLTPLEQINVVTSILYSYYGLKGSEVNYKEPNEFLLHKTLESKKGNQVSNGILYLHLCEMLDIPVRYVPIPQQFILGYFHPGYSAKDLPHPQQKIEFFIDPSSGQVFTHNEVEHYFKRLSVPPVPSYFRPQSNKQVIKWALEELSKCFTAEHENYKQRELLQLAALLD